MRHSNMAFDAACENIHLHNVIVKLCYHDLAIVLQYLCPQRHRALILSASTQSGPLKAFRHICYIYILACGYRNLKDYLTV